MIERITQIRESYNMSRAEFAKTIGVDASTITLWEKGGNVSPQSQQLICKTFKISLKWLRTGIGDPNAIDDNPAETAGDRLRLLRNTLQLTQKQFAERVGCSMMSIVFYERDGKIPDKKQYLICETFGANYFWLATGEGKMFQNEEERKEAPSSPADLARQCGCDEVTTAIFTRFINLKPDVRESFVRMLVYLISNQGDAPTEPLPAKNSSGAGTIIVRDLFKCSGITISNNDNS